MDIVEIRRARLKQWFAERTLPEREKSYLSQLMNGKASFGEKAARRLEKTYGMTPGHLDTEMEEAASPPASYPSDDILTYWHDLLSAEQKAMLDQIRPLAEHNRAVMEQLQPYRVVRVHERRRQQLPFNHPERRKRGAKD